MPSFSARLRGLIHWGSTSRAVDESGSAPVQEVAYLGKTSNQVPWFPFGYDASVPAEKLVVVASILGDADSQIMFPGSPGEGPAKASGEVVVYHPSSGARVHMKRDGSILIEPASGQEVKVDGDLTVTGDVDVEGDTTLAANVTSLGKDISNTHLHLGSATAPTGGVSNTGIPV